MNATLGRDSMKKGLEKIMHIMAESHNMEAVSRPPVNRLVDRYLFFPNVKACPNLYATVEITGYELAQQDSDEAVRSLVMSRFEAALERLRGASLYPTQTEPII